MTSSVSSTRPQAVSALREIARAINAAWDLDTTLDLIARKTTEVMHVDSCTIYLLDPAAICCACKLPPASRAGRWVGPPSKWAKA
ncbi:MAG: hypothetical protein M5U34_20060 [Chloroflexi bacterium]|nr:hypothetical protein [Chloroflexota bacterium]